MADPAISRITVEREESWLRVKGNVDEALTKLIAQRLATVPESQRAQLKVELERRIGATRDNMFKLANPNLRVNGHDYEDFVEATEPFDEILDRRIWSLNAERVEWDLHIAGQRRQKPAKLWQSEQGLESMRRQSEYVPEEVPPIPEEELRVEAAPRHEETVETFKQTIANLADLSAAAPSQMQRATRALSIREEVASLPV